MDLPPLTYISVDNVSEGVGASQVLPYVEALSRAGMAVTLHSFEKNHPSPAVAARLDQAGVSWSPHPWGSGGSTAGLARLIKGANCLRGAELVHARSDIPAGSALMARCPAWVWDMRGFWADERIEAGLLRPGSIPERTMRAIERGAARKAGGIVTLTAAAIDVLEMRHGPVVRGKAKVITTCTDLARFSVSPIPPVPPYRLLLAGTLSRRYDVPLMLRLLDELRRSAPTELVALVPEPSPWERELRRAGVELGRATPSEMPGHVAASHAGLCVLRHDGGIAMKASMPTKVGEFLASGRPVVVNSGVGDLDALIKKFDCGVVVADPAEGELARAARELARLVADPDTPARCRALASAHFDLNKGVQALLTIYERVLVADGVAPRPPTSPAADPNGGVQARPGPPGALQRPQGGTGPSPIGCSWPADPVAFTVVVPCRGRHALVEETVGRLLELGCQTVLVDDGSDPPLNPPAHQLLTIVRQDPSGAGAARNAGVAHCQSDWVCFTDSDTLWGEHTLARVQHLIATVPNGTWVCGDTCIPPSERSITAAWMKRLQDTSRPPAGATDIYLATPLFLCRRQEFLEVGGFLPLEGCGGEDLELGQRMRATGMRLVFDPDWLALNCDRPFTFTRLVARGENYRQKRQLLLDLGIAVDGWMEMGPSRWRHALVRPLATEVATRALDRVGNLPDGHGAGAVVSPLLRACYSARMRRIRR